ncbi:MAG: tRNA (adenosine(37)-N6)-threonylcarbamoyltransferase complex transferase subunit TsaD, partial [Lentisphaeria bacterium]|nr:tRNA (adenosine(37)-N6)-threonylcarbamoyltransferase complex transferase subunit TsaD [Lentisphaeria bacterium]
MIVLGIETSCDETAAAVVRDGHQVLANVIASQVAKHAPYGGVVPELAAREHLQAVDPIVRQAVEQAAITIEDVDAVAVTATPGLLPALLVGVAYAKGLAASLERPLIAVDHLQAHVFGALIDHPE